MSIVKLFSGSATEKLASDIAKRYGQPLGECEKQKFSDQEMGVFYKESVRGCNVYIIQSTIPPSDNILELLLMVDAAKRASAKYVTVVVPYYGYARQDRKDKPRVAIGAKLMANLLTSAGADRIMTCDLHAGQIQGFFDIPLDHLDASAIFVPYIKSLDLDNLVIASPDVGGSKRARRYAKYFEADMIICDKERKRANEIASMRIIGDVKGKDIVLVDDMVDTAGTISTAATIIMENGANSVRAIATHGVLSGNAHEKLNNSALEKLIITDTIPQQDSGKVEVLSVAGFFADAIDKLETNESISSLFIHH